MLKLETNSTVRKIEIYVLPTERKILLVGLVRAKKLKEKSRVQPKYLPLRSPVVPGAFTGKLLGAHPSLQT